ncbi:poly-gamma-glutamate synthase PgsB [Endozoicomonas sp. SM1973]|uniref:Poly-gamma-glutamate synthase PgsB n=1 Tax=Spartinivicinus marinus TaxID=2994442 RepID=A0A853I970_9GAMM|nr:poly-gamma-glutamate synthase PgsB [Spartinivicinus marinus]MCX4028541.1 poly-gamma-glutamate synthase PgsB [Spartinivicinus marinus]NYZ67208.1 poly-gamma-glutamate synthase PgsB [Spartinivicinus marinus]
MDIIVIMILLLFLIAITYLERRKHNRYLQSIPIRIHINGTRGKSSVARLIAAGLRQAGLKTLCKTTGSEAKLVLGNKDEITIKRGCIPNIIEQCKVVEFAESYRADVLIVECMALKPELQAYSELSLVKSTHGVITNSGPDHLDVMGPTERDVAKALAGTVPVNGKLYTNEKKYLNIFKKAAADRNSQLVALIASNSISSADMNGFSYIEHQENVALALSVCRDLGVDRQTALQGMWQSTPDLGAMDIKQLTWQETQLILVNAFAANDPLSSKLCWEQALERLVDNSHKIMLVNCRADRRERSIQLGKMCASLTDIDKLFVLGTGRQAFIKTAMQHGVAAELIEVPIDQTSKSLVEQFTLLGGHKLLVVGIGNIKGVAADLLAFFSRRSSSSSSSNIVDVLEVNFG